MINSRFFSGSVVETRIKGNVRVFVFIVSTFRRSPLLTRFFTKRSGGYYCSVEVVTLFFYIFTFQETQKLYSFCFNLNSDVPTQNVIMGFIKQPQVKGQGAEHIGVDPRRRKKELNVYRL